MLRVARAANRGSVLQVLEGRLGHLGVAQLKSPEFERVTHPTGVSTITLSHFIASELKVPLKKYFICNFSCC
jgi:hypothetical protein